MSKDKQPGFEEALTRLEEIVDSLEKPDVTLEDSVKKFEEGVKLSKLCAKILEDAELRVEQVNQPKQENE